jgi:hypothetical protein
MDKSRKKIAIIVAIIIFLVLGAVLPFLLLRQRTTGGEEQRYLTIEEWNVKLVIPDSISDVRYQIKDDILAFVAKPTDKDVKYIENLDTDFFEYAKNRIIRGEKGKQGFENGIVIGNYSFVFFRLLTPNNLFGDIDNAFEIEKMTFGGLEEMGNSIKSLD